MGRLDAKEGKVLGQRLQAGSGDRRSTTGGFMLLELALALTILLLLFAIVWPLIGRGTNTAQHGATAQDIATLLRSDRSAATRDGMSTGTRIDVAKRMVTSADGRHVRVPDDLAMEVTTTSQCSEGTQRFVILFTPDGSSCGAIVVLSKGRQALAVRVNWLSGMIDVITVPRS
jgi:general secretion pathway protein H